MLMLDHLASLLDVPGSGAVLFVLVPVLTKYQQWNKKRIYQQKKKSRQPRLGNTDPLHGRHKWLGGALNSDNSAIFAIPAHAKHVLKITPDLCGGERVEVIGSKPLNANYKYLRAILAQDNMIYGVPCFAKKVIQIDPLTSEVTQFGSDLPAGEWMWHGGAIAPCGTIYGVPCNAETVIKISPSTKEVSLIGNLPQGRNKWYGALLGRDGCIYGMAYKAKGVLRINPRTDDVRVIGNFQESFKWHGGTVGVDGSIYAFPSHADTVLRITPPKECASEDCNHGVTLEELQLSPKCDPASMLGKYKWGGGATDREGNIYGIPSDAQSVLRLNPHTGEVITFGKLPDDHNKWQGGVLGEDGNIYCVPCDADFVLVINPYTLELTEIGRGKFPSGRDKFQGGFTCGQDGNIYCIPETSPVIIKIVIKTQEVVVIDTVDK